MLPQPFQATLPSHTLVEGLSLTAADSLVRFWREIENQGKKPTVSLVLRFVRSLGFSIPNEEAYRLLSKFTERRRRDSGEITERHLSTNGVPTESSRIIYGAPSRARNKVSLVPNPGLVIADAITPDGIPPKKPSHEDDLKAYVLLDACWKVLVEHKPDLAMDRKTWRDRNKSAALALAAAGKSPAECADRLQLAYRGPRSEFYGGIVMLGKLQEHWTNILPTQSMAHVRENFKPMDPEITPEMQAENVRRIAELAASFGDKYSEARTA